MRRILGVLLASMFCAGLAHAEDGPFAAIAAAPHPALIVKWKAVQRRIAEDEASVATCRAEPWTCSAAELRLEALVASGREREGRARIGEINRAVNLAIRPANDERRFGVADRWSSPLETVRDGAGDCEDYAILKLLALKEAGIASEDLKLLIVHDRSSRTSHAVATVRLEGRWIVLDNRGFALVDLESTRYRLLAKLDTAIDDVHHAALEQASPDAFRDIM